MSGVVVQLIAVRRIDECGHCRKDCSGVSVPGRCRREDGPHHAVHHPGKGGQGRFNFISFDATDAAQVARVKSAHAVYSWEGSTLYPWKLSELSYAA